MNYVVQNDAARVNFWGKFLFFTKLFKQHYLVNLFNGNLQRHSVHKMPLPSLEHRPVPFFHHSSFLPCSNKETIFSLDIEEGLLIRRKQ